MVNTDKLVEDVAKAIDFAIETAAEEGLPPADVTVDELQAAAKAAIAATGVLEMRGALEDLLADNEEYIRINNLFDEKGFPATTQTMNNARNALSNTHEPEKVET